MPGSRRTRHRLMVSVARDRRWIAWLEDARVLEFRSWRDDDEALTGNIYLGRILRVDKGIGAAFVDIGRGQAAFLPMDEAPRHLVEGASIVVQIERQGWSGKAPRATARPALTGARLLFRPGRRGVSVSERIADKAERARLSAILNAADDLEGSVVLRTAAAGASARLLLDEAAALQTRWRELAAAAATSRRPELLLRQPPVDLQWLRDRGRRFDEIFYDSRRAADTALEWCRQSLPELTSRIGHLRAAAWDPSPAEILEQVREGLEPRVPLPSGGSIVIQPTEAMTVVDVNAESSGSAQADLASERANLRNNLAAAEEVARQLRLRNVGGIIVVDFVDLKSGTARRQVVDRLRAAVADDPVPVWVGAMSRLGLVELTRQRRGPTLSEVMTQACATCGGAGRIPADIAGWMPVSGA